MQWTVGVDRRIISPPWGVELAGLGYYLNRTWRRVNDDLTATAIVVADERGTAVAMLAVDLMYNDAEFTRWIRERVSAHIPIRPEAICVNCSHSHNAPTAGWFRGGGERDADYLRHAAAQAATAVIVAWHRREPARLRAGAQTVENLIFNRTRDNGPVDERVGVLFAEAVDGRPLAAVVNFHAHPTLFMMADPYAVSRDLPGVVVDRVEKGLPGVKALYLQGACGDVEFRRELATASRRHEPVGILTNVALEAIERSRPVERLGVAAVCQDVVLPTRRWDQKEILEQQEEAEYRLATGDTSGWQSGMARIFVNQPERLPLRYGGSVDKAVAAICRFATEWSNEAATQQAVPFQEFTTEIQALRIGDVYMSANPSEFFVSFDLDLRQRWGAEDLFVLGYSNGNIGYLPDAHDIARKSYAAIQSPKALARLPFTAASGPAMVEGLIDALPQTREA